MRITPVGAPVARQQRVRRVRTVLALYARAKCYHQHMASARTTFTLDDELASRARALGVNVSAAARQGVADAVHAALTRSDREAYARHPERVDTFWDEAEAWGEE